MEEKIKQNFELKKILLGAVISLFIGLIGTGVWKFVDWNQKKVLNSFTLTLNPSDGETRKTLYMEIYTDMTGVAKNDQFKFEIKEVLFQPNDKLIFKLIKDKSLIELNGFYNDSTKKYAGIVLGNEIQTGLIINGWEATIQ